MPKVAPPDVDRIQRIFAKQKVIAAKRRGAKSRVGGDVYSFANEDVRELRYRECRGLRFCPDCRMYFDRDASSAKAIMGLMCMQLRGEPRPAAFARAMADTTTDSKTVTTDNAIEVMRSEIVPHLGTVDSLEATYPRQGHP